MLSRVHHRGQISSTLKVSNDGLQECLCSPLILPCIWAGPAPVGFLLPHKVPLASHQSGTYLFTYIFPCSHFMWWSISRFLLTSCLNPFPLMLIYWFQSCPLGQKKYKSSSSMGQFLKYLNTTDIPSPQLSPLGWIFNSLSWDNGFNTHYLHSPSLNLLQLITVMWI